MLSAAYCLLLLLLLPLLLVLSIETAFNDDVLGLIVFKASVTDPQSRLATWSEEDNSACDWPGVKCDPTTNRVSELLLDGFSLSGRIGRSLERLQFLRVLQLSRNNFSGALIPGILQLPTLQVVDLGDNNLSGSIPEELFQQCGSLKAISLANNNLTGSIPLSLSSCSNLESLNLSSNRLSGQFISGLWSLSSLQLLNLSGNMLAGEIPKGLENLYSLTVIDLSRNNFAGWLPENIGSCSLLQSVDFGENYLTGGLPPSMRKLGSCRYLDVHGNLLTGEFPDWIGEMRSLELLDISSNNFSGRVPTSVGNLQSLKQVNISDNQFVGYLPDSFGGCVNLKVLDVGNNLLSGNLPSWTFKLALESISFAANRYSGSISIPAPSVVQSFHSLQVLDLSSNALTGGIPSVLGKFSMLQALNLSWNSLVGPIPPIIGGLNTTSTLDLSHNQLIGSIPAEIEQATSLLELRLENNILTGTIPAAMGKCSSLTSLVLSRNNLTGPIPVTIAILSNLEHLDLSFNNFSGILPRELTNLSHLVTFNVSFNRFQGELPVGGFFNTVPPSSVIGNPSLCGSIVKHSCPGVHPKPLVLNPNSSVSNHGPLSPNLRHKRIVLSISSIVAIAAAVFIALGVVTVSILNMHARTSMSQPTTAAFTFSGGDDFSPSHGTEANYGKLVMFTGEAEFVKGAQGLLNKNCELGRGGFGVVYKTELQDGRSVALKRLNTTSLVKCQEDFEREVKKLAKSRHPNLVMVEGYYWTPSLQLLINEYIPGGSLHRQLHDKEPGSCCVTWEQRLKVIQGVAKGLAHLHRMNVIHYNIKSSNILIDTGGIPKVGDFGLARLLPGLDRYILSSKVQSALGYMAPEFACQTVKINEKCDVYGFGVLILEVVTGKRPVEYMEDDVVVLCDMVREALDEKRIEECMDKEARCRMEEAIPVIKLGLICASQVPSNRPDMEEVMRILEVIQCPPAPAGFEEV